MKGLVHSIQSLGTVDGPGIRFVVFMQGCNLRCSCCHNPDTHSLKGGESFEPTEILQKVVRYKEYFGKGGGITVSGGEPLLQPIFCKELFALCKQNGINTCLDTSGSILNDDIKALLSVTDRILLDIKYTDDALYRKHAGCSLQKPLEFLQVADAMKIPVTLRQVIIPTVNDTESNVKALWMIAKKHSCIDKVEFLPFRKICQVKYDNLGIVFPFGHLPEASKEKITELEKYFSSL